jgi:hypothetical protein
MVYVSTLPNLNRNLLVIQYARWWSAFDFSRLISSLASTYFPAHASRETSLSLFDVPNPAPFFVDSRFLSGAYVTDADPFLNKLLFQIVAALSYSDRLLNKTTQSGNQSVSSNDPIYLAAKGSFFTVLPQLFDYARNPVNFYDQSTFETFYNLTWV